MAAPSHRGLGRRGTVLLVLLLGALGAWVAFARRDVEPGAETASLLEHIPANAFLVAVVDVAELRTTELGRRLLGDGRQVAGLGEIQTLCGSDPMNQVRRLAIAVPEGQNVGFGLFAAGDLVAADLLGCAERIVTERGGRPVRTTEGRFGVLSDASAALSSAQLAVADGGPLILGEPPYVQASLRLAEGQGDSLASGGPRHAALRRQLSGDVVQATVVLSAEQRATLAEELVAQRMADSPFKSIAAAGLSVSLGQEMTLHALLLCDEPEDGPRVADVLDEARRGEAQSPAATLSGLDVVLERLTVRARGREVHLRLRLPVDEALALVQRLLALRRLARQGFSPGEASTGDVEAAPDATPAVSASPEVSVERITPAPPRPTAEPKIAPAPEGAPP